MVAHNSLYPNFDFRFQRIFDRARRGTLHTPHGTVQTPNFIFCATKASIKSLAAHSIKELGVQMILSNTYHLMLQPGSSLIAKHGGIHRFMNWNAPMLSDSGGYQVFSMGFGSVSQEIKKNTQREQARSVLKITEEGVLFSSYIDGSKIFLSPESSIRTQRELGCDIILQFDECTPYHVDASYTEASMLRSLRWGKRSLNQFAASNDERQALYGIVQGGVYKKLRKISADETNELDFFGTAIGGSLGSCNEEMHEIVAETCPLLHNERPIHLLGIGDLRSIFWGVRCGIDSFDCVHPTRIARHAIALVPASLSPHGTLNLRKREHREADIPIDSQCSAPCCQQYSRSYIHHLFKARELLGMQLLSMHNVSHMLRVFAGIRSALDADQPEQAFLEQEQYWTGQSTKGSTSFP